jgi:hypothetical protein
MRIGFYRLILSGMLLFPLSVGVSAQSNAASSEQALRKEKAQIVVVKKKEREKQQKVQEIKKAKGDNRF